jgi:hypothetical protein
VLRKLPEAQTEADFRAMVRAAREFGAGENSETSSATYGRRYGLVSQDASDELQDREEEQKKAIESRARQLLGDRRFTQLQQAEAARQAAEQAYGEAEQRARRQ